MLIAAVVPFLLLEKKDLITLGRMGLIVSLPLGLIVILPLIIGSGIYYGCRRRNTVLDKIEDDYKGKVEKAGDIIFTIDQSGRFTYLNKKALEVVGYKKEDLLGSDFLLVIAPEYRDATIENFG